VVDLSNVSLSDLAAATGNVDFGDNKGVNVADPDANQDAATKKYHDDHKYTDAEAVAAMGTKADSNALHHDKFIPDAIAIHRNAVFTAGNGYTWFDWAANAIVDYDYGGLFSTIASRRITIKKKGIYLITFLGYFTVSASGYWRVLYMYVNGNNVASTNYNSNQNPTNQVMLCFSIQHEFDVSDYLEFRLYQDSGGDLNFNAHQAYHGCELSLIRTT